ncbi:MAG: hypothetical protein JO076_02220, partial [Verrucomicrobia bacterium]|nr:hypothetical protein [Verrucomicrobiota bacterium]
MQIQMPLRTRREFLRTSLLGTALSWTVPAFLERTFLALNAEAAQSAIQTKTGRDHPILVVIQLAGGNDGLNALVPFEDDLYYRSRPTLAVPKQQVLPLNNYFGLHPSLQPLKGLFDAGNLAVLQGVGYPNPNRSHFRSTEIWQTASDSKQVLSRGWIGRYFDNCCYGQDATVGVVLGEQLPQAFNSTPPTGIAIAHPDQMGFERETDPNDARLFAEANGLDNFSSSGGSIASLSGPNRSELTALQYLQRVAMEAQAGTDEVKQALKRARNEVVFP